MKVLWLKKGDPSASTQSSSNAGNCSVSAALGSADGIVEPPVPQAEPVYLGRHALCSGCMLLTPSSEGGGLSVANDSHGDDDSSSDVPARVSYGLDQ